MAAPSLAAAAVHVVVKTAELSVTEIARHYSGYQVLFNVHAGACYVSDIDAPLNLCDSNRSSQIWSSHQSSQRLNSTGCIT